ncbi:MAG: M56 family metallopeptidase [Candidatus Limnocylindria bacterium]
MGVALLASGAGLLLLPALSRPLGRQLPPHQWARLCAIALGAGGAIVEVAAALYAAPTVFRAAGIPAIAALCERMLGTLVPGGAWAGWVAAAVATMMPALAGIGVRRARRTQHAVHAEPWLGEHADWHGLDLVVLPTAHPVAVSVPGDPAQIIVSEGLLASLEPSALEFVLRHEAAHLEHGHHRYLLLATAMDHALAFFPPARASTRAMRAALERWADEVAAGARPADRRTLRDALLDVTGAIVSPALAAFSTSDTVVERVDALDRDVPRPGLATRAALYTPGLALGGVAIVALGTWAANAQMIVAMAGQCATT